MSKRFLTREEVQYFKKYVDAITSIPTWTNEKHKRKNDFFKYINNYRCISYKSYNKLRNTDGGRFMSWEYEIRDIPKEKRGHLSIFKGRQAIFICVGVDYFFQEFVIIPFKYKERLKT